MATSSNLLKPNGGGTATPSTGRLARIRPAPRWLHLLVLAAIILMMALGTWIVPRSSWWPLFHRTYGLVNLIYLTFFLVVVVGVLLGVGRRRLGEVGLEFQKLPAGIAYTCLVWAALQAVMLGWYWMFQESIDVANEWVGDGWIHNIGTFTGHFFGNAMNEEVVYRGFFLMQVVLIFRSRWPHRPRLAFVLGLVLVSAFFSAMHVPDRLMRSSYTSLPAVVTDQLRLFTVACVLGWVYWRTGNLFCAVGLHGLANLPTTLFAWRDLGPLRMPEPVVLALGVAFAMAWPRESAKRDPV